MDRPYRQVMGRRTYAALAAVTDGARVEGWHRMVQTPTSVFSRTLQEVSWPGATINRNDVVDEVPRMKASEDVDLRTIGSLSLMRQLLNAGHVDRLRLMIFPLIIGRTGQEPVFARLGDIAPELVSQTVLDGRVVLSDHRPAGTPPYVVDDERPRTKLRCRPGSVGGTVSGRGSGRLRRTTSSVMTRYPSSGR